VEASPAYLEVARSEAGSQYGSRPTQFILGDFAVIASTLPDADVVTLDRVVCCYPSADALLSNALGAAGSVFALTAPIDRGPIGMYNRTLFWLGNRWYALRARKFQGFRVFVHNLSAIEDRIVGAGFLPRTRQHRRLVWDLRVYERAAGQA
jgi:magnesium-protoporphyrin O-methyltransferase